MANTLQQYFPIIREKRDILQEIQNSAALCTTFYSWKLEQQEEFLNFCSGAKGVKMIYDGFFKEILSPEYAPERLNDFLSVLLGVKVKILFVLPTDSTRLGDESSLVIMDIVVQLEDGSIINIEMQKIGYKFPGERSACYSADLLLRQYKRVRDEKKERFKYSDIKQVYTIVLFDKAPKEFHQFPQEYLHYVEPKSNTGIELNLLQKYLFIPLDIFKIIRQNNGIRNEQDAWLTFLSSDDLDDIIYLIEHYPKFKPMYQEIYNLCQNMEKIMSIFSEELRILDQNTVKFMMDEMNEELENLKNQKTTLQNENADLQSKNTDLQSKNTDLQSKNTDLQSKNTDLQSKNTDLQNENTNLKSENADLQKQCSELLKQIYSLNNSSS